MELSVAEGRVLGCLIEKQVTESARTSDDTYSLGLDELRFSCNQTSGRDPVLAFDDRTVEDTLLSLKAMGLARFVTVGHRARPLSYRHRADERWRLGRPELSVFATLLLRGPQTVEQIWELLKDRSVVGSTTDVEVALDTLAGRTPTPLAARLAPSDDSADDNPGDVRWVEVLTGRFTLDQQRTDAFDPAPALPSRRGSGLPAREPWRPDDRFDSRRPVDPGDRRDQAPRRPEPAPSGRREPPEPQGRLDLPDRQNSQGPREPRDQRDQRDQRPGPPGQAGPPPRRREAPMPEPATAHAVPVAVPADQAARPAPTLTELADRLGSIERRLAGIEAALAALRPGGGPQQAPPPPPAPPQGAPPPQRQQGQPPRRGPSSPAPTRPHR